jgi:hypothetical protein
MWVKKERASDMEAFSVITCFPRGFRMRTRFDRRGGVAACLGTLASAAPHEDRSRARDLGVIVGALPTGEHNAITDAGCRS